MPDPNVPDIGHSPNPDFLRAAGGLRVTVDLNRCQAYAQCCYAAPEHFVLHGAEALHYDPAPTAAARDAIERARVACPVQAIFVEDTGSART
jgi:ferredoxin